MKEKHEKKEMHKEHKEKMHKELKMKEKELKSMEKEIKNHKEKMHKMHHEHKENKHFIKEAIKHPGSLRKELHVKKGEKIPEKKLEKAEHSKSPTLRKRAVLAETLKKMHK